MIEAQGVTVSFRGKLFRRPILALDGFNVHVEKGDVFALLGPNGAGKSTAMYCFLGLIRPEGGKITILGEKPVPGSRLFERIAYLPEEPHYHLYLTVEEAIEYYGSLYRKEIAPSRIRTVIEKVGLSEFRSLRMDQCSKGMKQKVGIATCLLNEAELVFLDEPTRGLDPLIVKEFRDILLEMNRQGVTIVINSHVLSEIEMVCNQAAIMNKGKVVVQDELRNLMRCDWENYAVEFEATDKVPEYITDIVRTAKSLRGMIPAAKLPDFFRFTQEANVKIYECSLKKMSLEEAFFDILKGDE